jgi:Asp-tRNA(Asn)/Glu-tRNA(Gln) amidotransferase A subunit family amidase
MKRTSNLDPSTLTASAAAAMIRSGRLTCERLAAACIERIERRDAPVGAWSYLDREAVLRKARELDDRPVRGPLHGIPIGVKDVILTADMPTRYNSALYEGFFPKIDAPCVGVLRGAGALIFGKNDTVEFAVNGRRALTRNPHDPARTPGGSSSGSAAAVADGQGPISLGTQTGGSIIRPASYCGVYAIKPTWNAVNHEGFKVCSATMETLGWYARSVEDLELLCDVFGIRDDQEPAPIGLQGAAVAVCRTPVWDQALPETRSAIDCAVTVLRNAGAVVSELELDPNFAGLTAAHRTIMQSEMRSSFLAEYVNFGDGLYDEIRATIRNDAKISRADLVKAYDLAARCRARFDELMSQFDAVLTPSAPGEAPVGLEDTGVAVFNRIWTLLHVPCVNVPGLKGPSGLPVGLTITGARFTDRRVLAIAGALGEKLGAVRHNQDGEENERLPGRP